MSSTSEASYGARIGNAEKLLTALQSFNNYQPIKQEYSIIAFADQISSVKAQNNTVAAKRQSYSLAVDHRQHVFTTGSNSIIKVLSPINSVVKAIYGKTAKEATDVATIIAKIRGANSKKAKSENPNEDTVSQSYQSYNSKTQYFSDLIVNLTNFGTNYTPANDEVTITALTAIYDEAINANNLVMDTFSKFVQNNNNRIDSYALLTKVSQSIKDSIKSQYGFNSSEYNLVKGLKI